MSTARTGYRLVRWRGEIQPVTITRETRVFYWIRHGVESREWRVDKSEVHLTWAAAHAALIHEATEALDRAQRALDGAQTVLTRVRAMLPPPGVA